MPELGKATYVIELDSRNFSKSLGNVRKEVDATTTATQKDFKDTETSSTDLDRSVTSLGKTFTRTSGTMRTTGKDSDSFRKKIHALHDTVELLGHAMKLLKWPVMLAVGGAAIRGLSMLTAGATALTGALGSATGGLVAMATSAAQATGNIASLVNVYGALGQAMLTVKISGAALAFGALSTNATTAQNAIKNTTGEAQTFAKQLYAMRGQFQQFRDAAGKGLFPGLIAGFKDATKNSGVLQKILQATGGSLGFLAEKLGKLLGSKSFGAQFQKFGLENAKVLRTLGTAAIHLFSAFVKIANIAKPLTNWWGRMIGNWAKGADQIAGTANEADKLNQFFMRTKEITKVLMDSLGHLFNFFQQVAHLAFGTGLSLWQQFDKFTKSIDDWAHTEGGRETIKTYFEHAKQALDALMNVVGPFVSALVHIMSLGRSSGMTLLDKMGEAANNFNEWTRSASGENTIKKWFNDMIPVMTQAGKLLAAITDDFFKVGRGLPMAGMLKQMRTELLPVLKQLLSQTSRTLAPTLIEIAVQIGKLLNVFMGVTGPIKLLLQTVKGLLIGINTLLANKLIANAAAWGAEIYGVYRFLKLVKGVLDAIVIKSAVAATNLKSAEGITAAAGLKRVGSEFKSGRSAAAAAAAPTLIPAGSPIVSEKFARGRATGNLRKTMQAGSMSERMGALTKSPVKAISATKTGGLLGRLGGAPAAEQGAEAALAGGPEIALGAAAVAAAVATLIGAFMGIRDNVLGIRDALGSFFKWFGDSIKSILDSISAGHGDTILATLGKGFKLLGDGLKWLWAHGKTVFEVVSVGIVAIVAAPILIGLGTLALTFKAISLAMKGIGIAGKWLVGAGKAVADFASGVGHWIGDVAVGAFKVLSTVVNALGTYFTNAFKDISGAVQKVVNFLAPIAKKVFELLSWPYRKWYGLVRMLFEKAVGVAKSIVKFLAPIGKDVFNVLSWPFRKLFGFVKGIIHDVIGFLSGIFTGKGGGGKFGKIAKNVLEVLTWPWRTWFSLVKGLPGKIVGVLKGLAGKIGGVMGAVKNALVGPFEAAGTAIWNAIGWVLKNVISRIPGVPTISIGTPPWAGDRAAPIAAHAGKGSLGATSGGHLAGGGAATGGVINRPGVLVGEEAPRHPEFVIATNPAYRKRNVGLLHGAAQALGVPGLAVGGAITGAIKTAAKGPGAIPAAALKAILNTIPTGLPGWLEPFRGWLVDKVSGLIDSKMGGGGGGLMPHIGVGLPSFVPGHDLLPHVSVGPTGVSAGVAGHNVSAGTSGVHGNRTGGIIGLAQGGVIGGSVGGVGMASGGGGGGGRNNSGPQLVKNADKFTKQYAKIINTNFGKAHKDAQRGTDKFVKGVGKSYNVMSNSTVKTTKAMWDHVTTTQQRSTKQWNNQLDKVTGKTNDSTKKWKDDLGSASSKINADYQGMVQVTGQAMTILVNNTNDLAKQLGINETINFSASKAGGTGSDGGGGKKNAAQGGVVGSVVPGTTGGDKHPLHLDGNHIANVESGELVTVNNRSSAANMLAHNRRYKRKASGFKHGGQVSGSMTAMIQDANAIDKQHPPYLLGGGHGTSWSTNQLFDCSGAVSNVLHAGGLLQSPEVSGSLMGWGSPGPGAVTIWSSPEHVVMALNGRVFGTSSAFNPGGGAGWIDEVHGDGGSLVSGGVVRHMGAKGSGAFGVNTKIPGVNIKGAGRLRDIAQAATNKDHSNLQKWLNKHMPKGTFGGGNIGDATFPALPGGWHRVGATYEGLDGQQGAYGTVGGMGFAELLLAGANAGMHPNLEDVLSTRIPPMGRVQFRMPGARRAAGAVKNDIGSGQAGNGHYLVDIQTGLANAIGWHPNQDVEVKAFGRGGKAPGPLGHPMPAIVHGGEDIFKPGEVEKLLSARGDGKQGKMKMEITNWDKGTGYIYDISTDAANEAIDGYDQHLDQLARHRVPR